MENPKQEWMMTGGTHYFRTPPHHFSWEDVAKHSKHSIHPALKSSLLWEDRLDRNFGPSFTSTLQ
jgi:hypothetical protein